MKRIFSLKLVSVFIGVIPFLLAYIGFTLIFNSIIISHYGGIDISLYFLISLLIAIGIAFFSSQIQLFTSQKNVLSQLLLLISISALICFILIYIIALINQFSLKGNLNSRAIKYILRSYLFYSLIFSSTLQIWFLSRYVLKGNNDFKWTKLIFQILFIPISASIFYSIINFNSLKDSYSKIPDGQIILFSSELKSHQIRIIYGEKNAPQLPLENDSLLFSIPSNGILIIQNKMSKNDYGRKYYSVNKEGKREEINRSSYQIVKGYNSRDDSTSYDFQPESRFKLSKHLKYENIYVDLENVNEDILFEEFLNDKLIDRDDYFFYESEQKRKYRNLRDIKYDSLTIELLREIRE